MKQTGTVLLLTLSLAGTLYAAQTAGDIIKLRQQKAKSAGDIIELRKQKESKPKVLNPEANSYFSVGAGPALAGGSNFDTGYGLTFALGVAFQELPTRLEFEYAMQQNDQEEKSSGDDITQHTFMGNLCYDFENGTAFTPYIFGGLGLACAEEKTSDTGLAYQTGAGLGYFLSEKTALEIKYRYLGTSSAGADSHNITLGIRYSF
jgi:opacity protein-like surface antigen